jgi:prepilin-type N-terminal cleavage/methylation domain-containing protein
MRSNGSTNTDTAIQGARRTSGAGSKARLRQNGQWFTRLHAVRAKRGFTLVELIVTLVILTVLAGLAAPSISAYAKRYNIRQSVDETKILVNGVKSLLAFDYADGRTSTDAGGVFAQRPDSDTYGFADNGVAAGKIKSSVGLDIPPGTDCVLFHVANPAGSGYAPFDLEDLIYYPDDVTDVGSRAVVYIKDIGYFVIERTTAEPLTQLEAILVAPYPPDAPDA